MYKEVCGKGERSVRTAVEVMRWKTASSMKCGAEEPGSSGGSGLIGRLGLGGGLSFGVGMVILKMDRLRPRRGWEGMESAWVRRVRVVL